VLGGLESQKSWIRQRLLKYKEKPLKTELRYFGQGSIEHTKRSECLLCDPEVWWNLHMIATT